MNADTVADKLCEASIGPTQGQLDDIMRVIEEVMDAYVDIDTFEQEANKRMAEEGYPIRFDRRDELLNKNHAPGRVGEDAMVLMPPQIFGLEILRHVISHEGVHVFQMAAAERKGKAAEMFQSSDKRMMGPGGVYDRNAYYTDKHEVMAHARSLIDKYRAQRMNRGQALQQLRTDPSAGRVHREQRKRFLKNAYNYAQDLPEAADPDDPDAFLKRLHPNWRKISHVRDCHRYYVDEVGRIAVADDSIVWQNRPDTCEDGLLLLNSEQPIKRYQGREYKTYYSLPVIQHRAGYSAGAAVAASISANEKEFLDLWPHLEQRGFQIEGQVQEAADPDELDPQRYIDSTPLHRIGRPKLDEFTRSYAACALWSSNDNSDPETGGEPMDRNYDIDDIEDETLWDMVDDCANFRQQHAGLLEQSGLSDDRAGFCFWLSRCGHGSGFFDEGTEVDDELQEAAEVFGNVDLEVSDEGTIYAL